MDTQRGKQSMNSAARLIGNRLKVCWKMSWGKRFRNKHVNNSWVLMVISLSFYRRKGESESLESQAQLDTYCFSQRSQNTLVLSIKNS